MKRRNLLKGIGLGVGSLFAGKVLGSEVTISRPLHGHPIDYELIGVTRDMEGIPVVRVPMGLIERSKEFSGYEERNVLHMLTQQLKEIS